MSKIRHTALAVFVLTLATNFVSQIAHADSKAHPNSFWWPEMLDLSPLRQHATESNPMGSDFDYAEAFNQLDLDEVKQDIAAVLTTSQDWWPADYGHYGPLFIRMAWHSAGTYRVADGRGGAGGGQQRFEPLNSWPDNVSLDKARRLLWPVKQKYGASISWADLMVLAGNVSLESMGFNTFGFAGGREDDWEPDLVYWGAEEAWLADDKRYSGERQLENPLAAVQMGLIYVNPEGPNGNPDPLAAAADIRETFGRMAMNDEETVALIAGGHTFGKAHGAVSHDCVGIEPGGAALEEQGFGWKNKCGKGNAEDTFTSGLEGAWSANPIAWSSQYLDNLFSFEWVQTKSPAGAIQWVPKNADQVKFVPDAHVSGKMHAPIMFTTDLSLKFDPDYREIAERFQKDPAAYQLAFSKAWFKLTHRDLGPRARYLGPEVPEEILIWQDAVPEADYKLVSARDISKLKKALRESGLSDQALIKTAWASASTFRGTDMRGGANGARIQLAPQKDWAVNEPEQLNQVLSTLRRIQKDFNDSKRGKTQISLADLIVLGGAVGIENAAKRGGHDIQVPFQPGRTDALADQTDVVSFAALEPRADAFRNYFGPNNLRSPAAMMIDKADMLTLSVPEMTVLFGGLRVMDVNYQESDLGVLTENPGTLSNDFFVNLLDMSTQWAKASETEYEGRDRATQEIKWRASTVDLVYGSNSELRALSEYYAADDMRDAFIQDFVDAWVKVMTLDRFDLI